MVDASRPSQIDTWMAAEENAAAWMRDWGYPDARVTPPGRDGGVDVRSREALAQVKFEAAQVGAPALQRLVGARAREHHKELFFFSGAGFASTAVEYADTMDIALFQYDLLGRMTAKNRCAANVITRARQTKEAVRARQTGNRVGPRVPRTEPLANRGCMRWWSGLLATLLLLQVAVNFIISLLRHESGFDAWLRPPISVVLGLLFGAIWLGSYARSGGEPNTYPRRFAAEVDPTRAAPMEIESVALQIQLGNKIAAIKAYRDATGAGLAEAKAAVEDAWPD
jgi:hypothetical protein